MRRYFERAYRSEDPYGILDDPLEEEKRRYSLEALEGRRYGEALEIGCGEGVLAAELARQVEDLWVVDLSERALERARVRIGEHDHVRVSRLDVLAEPIEGDFDLIVCSEVLVYIPIARLGEVEDKIAARLRPGGDLLLVHSRSIHDDERGLEYKDFGARTIHELFLEDPRLDGRVDDVHDMYRVTLLRKSGNGGE